LRRIGAFNRIVSPGEFRPESLDWREDSEAVATRVTFGEK
jgi:hypothetical protein